MPKKPNQPGLTVWVTNDEMNREWVRVHTSKPTLMRDGRRRWWRSEHGHMKLCASATAKALAPYKLPRRWKCRKYTARLTP